MRATLPAVLLLATLASAGCFSELVGRSDGPGPRDYLSSAKYDRLIIEIDTVEGMDPPVAALDTLRARLVEVVDKPAGVELRKDETLRPRGSPWTDDAVLAASSSNRDIKTDGDTVVIHLLFVDNEYADGRVLGATYSAKRGDNVVSTGPIVIFSETIKDAACPPPLGVCFFEQQTWTAVLVHEFGHALGLVNNGIPMVTPHEANECGGQPDRGHSSSTSSVMNCQVETINVRNAFTNGPPTTFDVNDKKDLCAVSGRC